MCITALMSARWVNACGKLPEVAPAVRVDLLGVEQQRARVGEQLLAQRPGSLDLADLGEGGDEPERADRERPLLARPARRRSSPRGSAAPGRRPSARRRSPARSRAPVRRTEAGSRPAGAAAARRRGRRCRSAARRRRDRRFRARRCPRASPRRRLPSARPPPRRRADARAARRGRRRPSRTASRT